MTKRTDLPIANVHADVIGGNSFMIAKGENISILCFSLIFIACLLLPMSFCIYTDTLQAENRENNLCIPNHKLRVKGVGVATWAWHGSM